MLGIVINVLSVALGGLLGTVFGKKMSKEFTAQLNLVFGVCAAGMGVSSIGLMENMPAVILAMVVGTAIGLAVHLGDLIAKSGRLLEKPVSALLGDKAGSEAFTYKRRGRSGFRMTRYMKDLEWYLVVQSFSQKESLAGTWFSIITLYILLAAILVTVLIGNRKPNSHYIIKTDLTEDTLTGLPNRNYLKESYGEMGIFNTTRYKSLAMFDIDRFKAINETRDGDRILVTIAELAKKTVDNRGLVFRWSGDEFVLFLEMDGDEAEARLKNFCEEVQKQTDVTVSVGIVDVDLTESIKTNYHRAVQPCYAVKETGGNGVRRK